MARALRVIGTIAAGVALIATGVGAFAGGAVIGTTAAGTAVTAGAVAAKVATIASVTAAVANVGAQLTAPKPIARGSPAQVVIDLEPPRPYVVGQVMTGGVLRYDAAYGPTIKKVPNPYRWQVRVISGVGPIGGWLGDFFDFEPIGSFYSSGFLNIVRQLGARPEASALVPPLGAAPGWDANSKLSGCAAVGLNLRFDRDGERYANGIPIYTALVEGEKVYDARQDSTFPGGSGPCRLGQEATYVYSRNPACHWATYAFGRFQNGKRIFGLGLSAEAIDWPAVVDWANDCDANEWTANCILTEGGRGSDLREQRVRNLDDLAAAGGARWFQTGGLLSVDWHRPRVALATLTDDDILEAGGGTDAVQTVRERMNGVRPQYVSPDHNWQQITAAEIIGTTYRTEDGEPLTQVWPLNAVTNPQQAGELAAYAMADSRELGPMDLQAKAKWRFYRPGDCLQIDSSLVAYQGQAVINQRSLNPQTLAVGLSLKSETPGKHAFALGKVATPPPTPTLAQTPEERDLLAAALRRPRAVEVEFDGGETAEDLKPAEAGSNRTQTANANRVPFSLMEKDKGWQLLFNPSAIPATINFGTFSGLRFVQLQCDPTAAGQQISFGQPVPSFRVTPGERLSIQSRIELLGSAPGSTWQLELWTFNAAGDAFTSILANGTIGRSITEAPVAAFFDVPAGRVSARLELRIGSGAAGFLQAAIAHPMVTSALPGQTIHPPFTPGPNAFDAADVTGENVAAAVNGQGPWATFTGETPADLIDDIAIATANSEITLAAVNNMAADGVFDIVEKQQTRPLRNDIVIEFPVWRDRAIALGISTTAYQAAYDALIAFLGSVAIDTNVNTAMDRATFTSRFSDYFATRAAIFDGITNRASQIATNLPLGNSNRVPFSLMEKDKGWQLLFNPSSVPTAIAFGEFGGRRFVQLQSDPTAGGQQISFGQSGPVFKVEPNERLSVQARVELTGTAGGTWQLELWTFQADGVTQAAQPIASGLVGRTISDAPVQAFVTVPAGRFFGRLELRVTSGTAGYMQGGISEPMVTSAAAEQTVHPPFTPGPRAFAGADVTVDQPVVGLLNPVTGRATSRRLTSQIVAGGVLQTLNTNPITATTDPNTGISTITINAHTVFDDFGQTDFSAGSIGGLSPNQLYYVYEFNPDFVGGARTYIATTSRNDLTTFGRRYVGFVTTPATGSGPVDGNGGGGAGFPGLNPELAP